MAVAKNTSQRIDATCTSCGITFKRRPGGRATCKASCKVAEHRGKADKQAQANRTKAEKAKARIEEQFTRYYKSTLGNYIARECRKAGTVGILLGHTSASLFELESFNKRYNSCNGWHSDDDLAELHRCHIQARSGKDGSVGALHANNLFVGEAIPNQKYSNKVVSSDAGLSIPASKLNPEWKVDKRATNAEIAEKVRKLLGTEFLEYLSLSPAIKMDQRNTLARQIHNRQQAGTAVRELEQRHTKGYLETLSLDQLLEMDAYQRGRDFVKKWRPENYTRAALCVYADELERMANVSPSERHRGSCRFMLNLIRVLGMFVAQMQTPQGIEHRDFLTLRYLEWQPLEYRRWQQPWGKPSKSLVDADQQFLITNLTEHCFHALAGADVPQELLQARLLKRLDVATLAPTVQVPNESQFKALGSWDAYIAALYAEAEPIWQALLELGMCDTDEVATARAGLLTALQGAITTGQARYRNQDRFKRTVRGKGYTDWGFKGYPAHLEYPPAIAPGADATTRAA
jgi:hypothetical protein